MLNCKPPARATLCVLAVIANTAFAQGVEDSYLPVLGCQLEPKTTTELSSSSRGKLAEINVRRGDEVELGQVLAAMETGVEKLNVKLATTRAAMSMEVEAKEARLKLAQLSEQRTRELADKNMISSMQLDEVSTESTVARLEATQAQEQRALAQVELERARELLEQRYIRSTVNGVVVELYKEVGEFVDEEAVLKLAEIDPLKVEVIAPVKMFGQFQEGGSYQVTVELAGIGPLIAQVDVVDRIVDPGSGTFRVSLILPNPENKIPAGLSCELSEI